MEAPWRIQMFGGLRAERGDLTISRFRTQKTGSLLAYLAFHLERSHPREVLIEILWPECAPAAGRQSLSMALTSLRHQLEPPGVPAGSVIKADRFTLQMNPSVVKTDVAGFEEALQRAGVAACDTERAQCLTEAADVYRGELLPGYYHDWVIKEQRRLADLYFRAIRRLTSHLEGAKDWERAIDYARRAVAVNPFREESHQDLMRLLAASGQPSAALQQFEELRRILKEELDATPSPATCKLAREIELQAAGNKVSVSVLQTPRVAALPTPSPALLTGTVTFFLAEIQKASTGQLPTEHRAAEASENWSELACQTARDHGGCEIKVAADSFTAAFERASDALACAVACQKAVAGCLQHEREGPLCVRIALDTREVRPKEGEAPGWLLRRATGLLLAAHGGQILCSEATAGLLRSDLAPDVRLNDLGFYRLRGVESPERLFAIAHPDVASSAFPPPNAAPAYTSNLPLQFTAFFGREEELARLQAALTSDETRLVTLTGSGGCGKTRLAIEAARHLADAFRGAVWFVPLQDLSDARLIADGILGALRVPRSPSLDAMEQVAEALARQPSLVLLDNFEHLADEGAPIVRALLERAPTLKCLVTSRRSLDLTGEREFHVAPLPTPGGEDAPEALVRVASVELFVDRAQAVRPDFQVTRSNARAVAELCDRLEGIPLALELAAARVQMLTPAQMVAQLEHRLDFLVSRKRDAIQRHQTLRASVEWSYRLLSPELQRSFAQLSVFRGGWTTEAAQAVCATPQATDHLAKLRDGSLILAEEGRDEPAAMRFRMLETLREYAAEQLSPNDLAALRQRHALFYLALAKEAQPHLESRDQIAWLDRVERDHDNFRAALEWCKSNDGDAEAGLELAVALARYWEVRGYFSEGRAHLQSLLAFKGAAPRTLLRANALNSAGCLARDQDDWGDAQAFFEECLAIRRELADKNGTAGGLNNLALVALVRGRYPEARRLLEEALAINRETGNRAWESNNLNNLGTIALYEGNYNTAQTYYEQCLAIRRELGNKRLLATVTSNLGLVARKRGDLDKAHALLLEAIGFERALGDRGAQAHELVNLGGIAVQQGDRAKARGLLKDGLTFAHELGEKLFVTAALDEIMGLCIDERRMEQAARLMGAGEALRETLGAPHTPSERSDYEESVAKVRAALDEDTFAAAWAEGESLTLDQAVAMALHELESP